MDPLVIVFLVLMAVVIPFLIWAGRLEKKIQRENQREEFGTTPLTVVVRPTFLHAETSLMAPSPLGKKGPKLRIAVLPTERKDGALIWAGSDAAGRPHDLVMVKEHAEVVIAADTLPLLKRSGIWWRVDRVVKI